MSDSVSEPRPNLYIYAFVRALWSPAVWLVSMFSVAFWVLFAIFEAAGAVLFELFILYMFGAAYLMAGACLAFVRHRGVVPINAALSDAPEAFLGFIGLMIKIAVPALLLLIMVFKIVYPEPAADMAEMAARTQMLVPPLSAFSFMIFAYWLPVAFVRSDFRLFETVRDALALLLRRLVDIPFFFLLLTVPPLAGWVLPSTTPKFLIAVLLLVTNLSSWIAYAYCVARLQEDAPRQD